jgi:hypothetical protein
MEVGESSAVLRNFIINAWPAIKILILNVQNSAEGILALPIALRLPGRTCMDVTPPAITSRMESSWVSNASMVLNQGKIGPLFEFKLKVPNSFDQWPEQLFGNTKRLVPCRVGKLYTPMCE